MEVRLRKPPGAVALLLPIVLLGLWWALTRNHPDGLIPQPGQIGSEFLDLAGLAGNNDSFSGSLWRNLLASAGRVYGGFLLSAGIAVPLGLMIGQIPLVRRMLDSTLQILRPVPVTAWQPLFLILFGLGSHTALLLVTLGCFYPILLNTILGVRSVEARLLEAAAMLGVSRSAIFPKVVLPSALPGIVTGLRLGLGFAWVVIVVGEISGVRTGLGAMITDAREVSRTDVVIAGMVTIGAIGFLSDRAVQLASRRVLRWSPRHAADG
ncbi:MAG TPA: ABC transporter permease [Stellaceae bacterium]|jgi:NitT/TauT family transport system permease protein|nr:ABC transporter permease [Stellaceae bacterium]